jgi:glucosamine kinase
MLALAHGGAIGQRAAMAEHLVFCVDGGGTWSRAHLLTPEGETLARAEAGPCNPTSDLEAATASVHALWSQLAEASGGLEPEDHHLAIGAAGAMAPAFRQAFLKALPRFKTITVMSDGYAALIGAGGGAPCGLVILGTGAVGHRLLPDGTSLQRDGWGWSGGDRGSGAWIGHRAVRATLQARDGLSASTTLTRWMEKALGASDAAILGWLAQVGPRRLASLAPLVADSAAAGDRLAAEIIEKAADHATALAKSLKVEAGEPLFLAGGLAGILRGRIEARMGRAFDNPRDDAILGAFLVATGAAPLEHRREDQP